MENDKMFEKKRNSIIKVIVILLILVSVSVFINIPFVSAGKWVYNSTVEDVYNVTISSDDAVAVLDAYFSSNGETITLKSNIYMSIIGLRFDNISLPYNSTYEYRPVNAFLSLYSDHYPYYPESQKVTIHSERDNNDIQTFTNYTDLVSRVPSYNFRNWDLDDVHGLNSTTGQWNDSPNIAILVTGATGFDEDTICFIIYSDRGVWDRYFRTYDHYVPYAPRLHIISDIYVWEELPPSEYEDAEYDSTYRGFEIWLRTLSNLIDLVYWNGTHEQYMEINTNSTDVEITGVTSQGSRPASYQIIRGPKNDIFYIGRVGGNQTLFHSYDEGETWDNYTINDQYAELIGNSNKDGSLAIDSYGELWIVWSNYMYVDPSNQYAIISISVTVENHSLTFSPDYDIVGFERVQHFAQTRPSLWIDVNDRKHLSFDAGWSPTYSEPKVQYSYKDHSGWAEPILISGTAYERHYYHSNIATSENGTFKIVVWTSDNSETSYSYYKTEWVKHLDLSTMGDEWGPHVSYNDNNDKVLIVWQLNSNIIYKIFDFSDLTLGPQLDTGVDGVYPDLTFDINSNKVLMVFDGGEDGLNGTIFDWDTESWDTTFSIRDIDSGYIHIASRATIDIGGGEDTGEWIVVDEDDDIIVILDIDDYPTIDDVEDWIDNYLSASSEYDKTPWMGDFTLLLVGLVGVAFIPLGFLIFVSSARDGDIIGGLQTLVLMFFIGIGCIITWLWA